MVVSDLGLVERAIEPAEYSRGLGMDGAKWQSVALLLPRV